MPRASGTNWDRLIDAAIKVGGAPLIVAVMFAGVYSLGFPDLLASLSGLINAITAKADAGQAVHMNTNPIYSLITAAIVGPLAFAVGLLSARNQKPTETNPPPE